MGVVVRGWPGRGYEDFTVGDVYRSRLGRTITRDTTTSGSTGDLTLNQMLLRLR